MAPSTRGAAVAPKVSKSRTVIHKANHSPIQKSQSWESSRRASRYNRPTGARKRHHSDNTHNDDGGAKRSPKQYTIPRATSASAAAAVSVDSNNSAASDSSDEVVFLGERKSPSHFHVAAAARKQLAPTAVASSAAASVTFLSKSRRSPSHLHARKQQGLTAAASASGGTGLREDPIDLFSSSPARANAQGNGGNQSSGNSTSTTTTTNNNNSTVFTCQQFMKMWERVNDDIGMSTEHIEDKRLIRAANIEVDKADSTEQGTAQYGRILFPAAQRVLYNILQVQRDQVFVDFGSGIGNTVLQAAYTIGCKSKGIEMVDDRHAVSCVYKIKLQEFQERYGRAFEEEYGVNKKPGKVNMRKGRLEDCRRFLTNPGKITKAFCNNFEGVFGYRSTKGGKVVEHCIDDYVAGLFCLMEPGSKLVTLHKLHLGPPPRTVANANRARAGLEASPNASFYEYKDVILGEARHVVSWSEGGGNKRPIHLYVYTRVAQGDTNTDGNEAVFLCNNTNCPNAANDTPISATKYTEHKVPGKEKLVKRYVINSCECGVTAKTLRSQKKKNYASL